MYSGHQPNDPVRIGTIPINPQGIGIAPAIVKYKIAIPAITLSIRSIPPIFVHIVLGVVPIMFTPQVNLSTIIDKLQLHLQ